MLDQTITDDSATGLKKSVAKLTLPVLEVTVYRSDTTNLKNEVKKSFLSLVDDILDKELN
tara:strand:+ start:797 stop:976 length:180 start_codon:yes stop_codon:yes gene_type:complete